MCGLRWFLFREFWMVIVYLGRGSQKSCINLVQQRCEQQNLQNLTYAIALRRPSNGYIDLGIM